MIGTGGSGYSPRMHLGRPSRRGALLLASLLAVAARADAGAGTFRLHAGYFGEMFLHPGVLLGVEYLPAGSRESGLAFGTSAGTYLHPGNHRGSLVQLELGYQLQLPLGFGIQATAGAGYLHTTVDGPLYEVRNGTVMEVEYGGRSSVTPSLALTLAWDLPRHLQLPLGVFVRAGAFGQYPFNQRLLIHPDVQMGLRYSFDRPPAAEGRP